MPEKPNLESGYEESLPLDEDSFQTILEHSNEGCMWLMKDLENFEASLKRKDSFEIENQALLFLEDFVTFMEAVDLHIKHSLDLERIFRDKNIRRSLTVALKALRDYDFIKIVEDSKTLDIDSNKSVSKTLEKARDYLLQAEIYLAGTNKSK